MESYWHIELYSGELIKVKPQNASEVQRKIATQEGSITTPTRSIVIKDIKDFRLSDEPYTDQKLLEGAAQAFDEPQLDPTGQVISRWVKKSVPKRRWETHYRFSPGYKLLEENDSFVVICFILPIHQIDSHQVQELDSTDLAQLSRRV